MQPNVNFAFLVNGSIDLYPIHISQFSAAENWDECVAQNMGMAKAVGGKSQPCGREALPAVAVRQTSCPHVSPHVSPTTHVSPHVSPYVSPHYPCPHISPSVSLQILMESLCQSPYHSQYPHVPVPLLAFQSHFPQCLLDLVLFVATLFACFACVGIS